MAPRKRKAAATAADNADSHVDDEAPLRRSSRRKTAARASDGQGEETTAQASGKQRIEKTSHASDKRGKKSTTQASDERGKDTATAANSQGENKQPRSTGPAQNQNHEAQDTSKIALDAQPHAEPDNATISDHPTRPFTQFTIDIPASKKGGKAISCLRSPSTPQHPRCLIFTHGAGGDLSAAAMVHFSAGFASRGEDATAGLIMFPGTMNVKARAAMFDLVKQHGLGQGDREGVNFAYGGRSMGARAAVMASHVDEDVKMLVLVSYPLVSPAGDVRDKILLEIRPDVDVLFISGDQDSMCDLDMLDKVRGKMKARSWLVRVRGADHGMNLRGGKKLKEGTEAVGATTGKVAAVWIKERDAEKREMELSWDGEGEHGDVVSSGWLAGGRNGQGEEKSKDVVEEELPRAEEGSRNRNPKRRKVKK
ncbi:hypothetical protein A1O7_05060 [Cladophialophora yegresii CBS 114405]|uniref:KANL3/Tex30 alpha/beta hydrolase-like domain-containing protein n=1 Tax=Cladophialophora yegresii CBS 114405 TaxID=1182544 RepID=W9VYL8_9EURO|nr:uncharacterized protein A1O7_05060 [Cladophialophora yegresii CBS 114405]EXJ60907.1 hypothetical protein A1O7_05060 [Cladophialophora yegresii CBS 114405]